MWRGGRALSSSKLTPPVRLALSLVYAQRDGRGAPPLSPAPEYVPRASLGVNTLPVTTLFQPRLHDLLLWDDWHDKSPLLRATERHYNLQPNCAASRCRSCFPRPARLPWRQARQILVLLLNTGHARMPPFGDTQTRPDDQKHRLSAIPLAAD